jgi:Domain of unknown function (DUF1990)
MMNRLGTVARLTAGGALTAWHYMWRTTPWSRREVPGSPGEDGPPPLPDAVDVAGLQLPEDGVGPLFHRCYRVRIRDARLSPEEVMARVTADPNRVAPTEMARFERIGEAKDRLAVGDEYVVRIAGPWDGPVRAVAVTPTSFRLATLTGHLEAGQIEFRVRQDDGLVFEIESWARSADRVVNFFYEFLPFAKESQLHMWTSMLEQVVQLTGGRRTGRMEIETRRADG